MPDTVGYTTPSEFKQLIRGLRANVKGVDGVTISVHGYVSSHPPTEYFYLSFYSSSSIGSSSSSFKPPTHPPTYTDTMTWVWQ